MRKAGRTALRAVALSRVLVLCCVCASLCALERTSAQESGSAGRQPTGPRVGVGFLWTRQSQQAASALTSRKDFVDVILGPGKLSVFERVQAPVRVVCIARALERSESRPFPGVKETIETLEGAGIPPERVVIAYNPERQPGTPSAEMDDLVASVRRARQMVQAYGAPLLVGPGLRDLEQREHLYPELAKYCDIWLIQSQRLQLDLTTRRPVDETEYRKNVQRIVDRVRKANPEIQVFVQLVTTAQRGARSLTVEEMVGYIRAVEDLVDAVRIYGGRAELITEVVARLDTAGQPGPPSATASPAAAASEEVEKEGVRIPMRDGAHLAADMYLPAGFSRETHPEGVPAILVCTPYGKDRGKAVHRWRGCFTKHGYAFIVEDMRGFHESADAGKGSPRHHDGYDTVEWLAARDWCNGKVGMIGYSHLGAAQYETAVTAPPHLACAMPAQAPANYYTDAYYPPRFRKADMETIFRGAFTSRTQQLIRRRIRSQQDDGVSEFNTPMLHSAGWYDFYTEGAVEMFRACQEHGGPNARGRQRLLIGPWGHGTLQEEDPGTPLRLPGGLAYPANSKLDWESEVWLPWFDYWLKGKDTGVLDRPAVRYYLMGDVDDAHAPGNAWIEAEDFPPEAERVPYFAQADHTLRTEPPGMESVAIEYTYDPADPVPTVGRAHARVPVKGPFDQRGVEGRQDVILFTTAKTAQPLAIVGQVEVKVWASSDRKDTDFTAKLTDVYPDGRSMLIADSLVKARYRNGFLEEDFLAPGEVYEFSIDLGYTAIALAPGHRLRLAISSSSFDRFDINPNTGEPYGDHALTRRLLAERLGAEPRPGQPQYTKAQVAHNAVHVGKDHPTQVVLPLVEVIDGGIRNARSAP